MLKILLGSSLENRVKGKQFLTAPPKRGQNTKDAYFDKEFIRLFEVIRYFKYKTLYLWSLEIIYLHNNCFVIARMNRIRMWLCYVADGDCKPKKRTSRIYHLNHRVFHQNRKYCIRIIMVLSIYSLLITLCKMHMFV